MYNMQNIWTIFQKNIRIAKTLLTSSTPQRIHNDFRLAPWNGITFLSTDPEVWQHVDSEGRLIF